MNVEWEKPEDLRRRTFLFGLRVVKVTEALPKSDAGRVIGKQLLRCGTSVGANYRAAARGRSRLEFISKLGIVEEETDEAIYWMEMLAELERLERTRLEPLLMEANEILSIIISSIKTARQNSRHS
jgi:four helix bundle protein